MRCPSAVPRGAAMASAAKGRSRPCSHHRLGTDRWTLGIDVPFDLAQRREMPGEGRRLHEGYEIAEELQLSSLERRLQALQEQTPIQSRQDADWEEEVGPAVDPASVGRKPAARHDAVGMWMMRQGVRHPAQDCGRDGGS